MVLGKTPHLELPRRVVVFYLLFCLATIVWLLLGTFMATRFVMRSRSENSALSRLERVSARLEIAYLRSGEEELQEQVEQIRKDSKLAYCAIVHPDGHFLAHSTSKLVGKRATEVLGDRSRWGEIECIESAGDGQRALREFRLPLSSGDTRFGVLRMGVAHPSAFGLMLSTSEFMPLALLGPIVLLVIGAVVLQRVVRPISEIDTQLRRIAVSPDVSQVALKDVRVRGAGALGWNRLVSQIKSGALHTDVEQRIGEALQSRASGKHSELLNSLPDGIAATDGQGAITFANRTFLSFLGRSSEDGLPVGLGVEDCLQLQELTPDSPLLDPQLAARQVVSEIKRGGADSERYLRLARYPLRTDGGQRSGHVWAIRDITQQKMADKMRDEFLENASHELRTPLANIRAYAETLTLSDMLDMEQQKEFCNTINEEATRLARLIDDLLSVSSMEAGSLAIRRKHTDVARMLQDVASKLRGQMDKKELTFETIFSEKLPEMMLDKDKFSTSLVNLLGNAVKYTPVGGRVALKAHVAESKLLIEVEDTGIGISPEELPQVFGKFFRSSDQRVRHITGTGLGLSLSQEVVRLHGGTLTVHSELDKGSTFTIALPV